MKLWSYVWSYVWVISIKIFAYVGFAQVVRCARKAKAAQNRLDVNTLHKFETGQA